MIIFSILCLNIQCSQFKGHLGAPGVHNLGNYAPGMCMIIPQFEYIHIYRNELMEILLGACLLIDLLPVCAQNISLISNTVYMCVFIYI